MMTGVLFAFVEFVFRFTICLSCLIDPDLTLQRSGRIRRVLMNDGRWERMVIMRAVKLG